MNLIAFLSSFLFALGLAASGMTQPEKVLGFLDVFGNWNPQLIFVMGGSICVYAPLFWITRNKRPILAKAFLVPTKAPLDKRLIVGSTIFGMGWGLSGYCPGPALTAISSFQKEPLIFVASMILGMKAYHWLSMKNASGINP